MWRRGGGSERGGGCEGGLGQQEGDDGRGVAEATGPYKRPGERGAAMKIRAVTVNNRRKVFAVRTSKGELVYPFAKADQRQIGRASCRERVWKTAVAGSIKKKKGRR